MLAAKTAPVELVLNGNIMGFLAEDEDGGGWSAFAFDQSKAVSKAVSKLDVQAPGRHMVADVINPIERDTG